jgi:hypothetical protein
MKSETQQIFICQDKTLITFGKFKGQPHSVLLEPDNRNYCKWLLSLEDFGESTKNYLVKNNID